MMNVHWLTPTQARGNPAFPEIKLWTSPVVLFSSQGLGSTSTSSWVTALAWSRTLSPAFPHMLGKGKKGAWTPKPWGTVKNTEQSQQCARHCTLSTTQSWEGEGPVRDHISVSEVSCRFTSIHSFDQVSPSPGTQRGFTNTSHDNVSTATPPVGRCSEGVER